MFDILVVVAVTGIWLMLLVNAILLIAGYLYYLETQKTQTEFTTTYPSVTILVPAHNEERVIYKTVLSLLALNYPHDRYEIIVINDNSSDNSKQVLQGIQEKFPDRRLRIINTTKENGGKGKSNALNIGYALSTGELIAVYDADNTPEKNALIHLVTAIEADSTLGAVIGKFRTRNAHVNLLTRFINIETLSFQWISTAGRWKLFGLGTIPGTNFIIRKSILAQMGGWDIHAIAEDTEISFRIYLMGYRIKFNPQAVTWEQEPQTLSVWFRQRTRWVKGNLYVLMKNAKYLLDPKARRIYFDLYYFIFMYFVLLLNLAISDLILLLGLFGVLEVNIMGFGNTVWLMAILLFVLSTFATLTTEKGELTYRNLLLISLMYFTYCKAWLGVAIYGFVLFIRDVVLKKEVKWYKTERF